VIAEIRKKLQTSLVLVGEIGGNDYNYEFFASKPIDEVEKLIPGVIKTIIGAAKVKHLTHTDCTDGIVTLVGS
jgi:hypothetical protein